MSRNGRGPTDLLIYWTKNRQDMKVINDIKFLTIPETAEILGLNPMTIRRWIAKGKIESVKIGQTLIREDEVNKLISGDTQNTDNE